MKANQLSLFTEAQLAQTRKSNQSNAARNSQAAMGVQKKDEVQKESGADRLESKVDLAQQPQVQQTGTTTKETGDGTFESTTKSGMQMTHRDDGTFDLKMPEGYQFAGNAEGKVTGRGPDGKPLGGQIEVGENEIPILSFEDKGVNFAVDLGTLDYEATKQLPTGSVTQFIQSDGMQSVTVTGAGPTEKGKEQQYTHQAVFSPEGKVVENSGMAIQGGEVHFELPNGVGTSRGLPLGGPRNFGPAAAPEPQTPAAPQTEAEAKPQAQTGPQDTAAQNTEVGGAARPTPMNQPLLEETPPVTGAGGEATSVEPLVSASGVTRVSLPDGTQLTQLHNGVSLTVKNDGTAVASTPNGQASPVTIEDWMSKDAASGKEFREKRYTFQDGEKNRYTMFEKSMDVVIESADGKVAQIAHPDGRIFTAARDENGGLHTSEVSPSEGYQYGSTGVFHDHSSPGQMFVEGQKPIKLPYGMPGPELGQQANTTLGNAPTSGYVPGLFPDTQQSPEPPEMDHGWPGNAPSYNNHPGQPQQGFKPSLWQRIKSVFTGENPGWGTAPADGPGWGHGPSGPYRTQGAGPIPGHQDPFYSPGGPPPPDMGGYPGGGCGCHYPHGNQGIGGMEHALAAQRSQLNMWLGISTLQTMLMPMTMFCSPFLFL